MVNSAQRTRKVLITCAHERGVGGVQLVLRDLVKWLELNECEVCFIYDAPLPSVRLRETVDSRGHRAFTCPMPVVVRNSLLISLPVFVAYLPIALFQLMGLLRRERVDVINCHYLDPYFIHLIIAARFLGLPAIVSVHGADVEEYVTCNVAHRFAYRLIMRGASRIVACSRGLARQTTEVFPGVSHKVTYVHNALDPSRYTTPSGTSQQLQSRLLCVCRHVRKKGVDTLLHAFALIGEKAPDALLVLAGDGPLLEDHKLLAQRLNISHRVQFMGAVAHAQVAPLFADCTLFILPSRSEPFGVVLLEAAYYSKPIVATRVGGIPEIIADGVDGVLVSPDSPDEMASAILTLIQDPGRSRRLGAQANRTLMARFLWRDRIKDYLDVFRGGGPISLEPPRTTDSATVSTPLRATGEG